VCDNLIDVRLRRPNETTTQHLFSVPAAMSPDQVLINLASHGGIRDDFNKVRYTDLTAAYVLTTRTTNGRTGYSAYLEIRAATATPLDEDGGFELRDGSDS